MTDTLEAGVRRELPPLGQRDAARKQIAWNLGCHNRLRLRRTRTTTPVDFWDSMSGLKRISIYTMAWQSPRRRWTMSACGSALVWECRTR